MTKRSLDFCIHKHLCAVQMRKESSMAIKNYVSFNFCYVYSYATVNNKILGVIPPHSISCVHDNDGR